ncbi:MAG: electron transfer flavoprotein subunit alpha/FixB family protein [Clostridia bacterium]
MNNNSALKEVWAVSQFTNGHTERTVLELIGKAAELAKDLAGRACLILIAETLEQEVVSLLTAAGADKIYFVANDTGGALNEHWAAREIAHLAELYKPEIMLFPSTIWGRSVAPQAAALLHTGITADCTALRIDENGFLVQIRPAFGASLLAEILCKTARPQIVTVRRGVFSLPTMDKERVGEIVKIGQSYPMDQIIKIISSSSRCNRGTRLHDAEIVIAGGKGVGSKEGFEKLKKLGKLVNGAIGASRAAVDAGYASYDMQVGQTGITIRPKLYIACGISGAVQHIAGVSSAEYIIAINTDKKEPIFRYADYGIAGDLHKTLDEVINFIKGERHYELQKKL